MNYLTSETEMELNEEITLMYELDNNHILSIEVTSDNIGIPKQLIDMIQIVK